MAENTDPAQKARVVSAVRRVVIVALAALLPTAVLLVADAEAATSTVSGSLKLGSGYHMVLVQANGRAKTVRIANSSGAFKLRTTRLAGSTLHLVRANGSYFGPVVLKAKGSRAYCTIRGRANLRLGKLQLKSGYARDVKVNRGRFDTREPYTVRSQLGKPIGAGNLGRVRTGTPKGYGGPGGDLDRDGIVGAFDIDDNGNLILDNADRTGRGDRRPQARDTVVTVRSEAVTRQSAGPERQFRISSNFRLPGGGAFQSTGEVRINANIPGIENVDGLIDTVLPPALLLFMPVMSGTADGSTATLDGLGNAWVREHSVGSYIYPMYEQDLSVPEHERVTAGHSKGPGLLDLVAAAARGGDAFVYPGAVAAQIMPGDAVIQRLDDGTQYAGVINFVFNTVPAVKSYRFGDGPATELTYDAQGAPANQGILVVPSGATTVTLTCWRPQRKAAPGETGSMVGSWVDIGKLTWEAPPQPQADRPGGSVPIETGDSGYIVNASSDTAAGSTPISVDPTAWDVTDTAADKPADPANTISLTLDFTAMFPQWGTDAIPSGSVVEIDLGARGTFGDLASSRVRFQVP